MSAQTRRMLPLAVAVVAPVAAAAALIPLRTHLDRAALALVMVVVVVAAASPGRRVSGWVAGVSAGLWFDFFLTRPYQSFAISSHNDAETAVGLVIVAVVVAEIGARRRRHQVETVVANFEIGRIHAVAQQVATGIPSAEVIEAVEAELEGLLFLDSCSFEPGPGPVPGPVIDRRGVLQYGQLDWHLDRDGLPAREVAVVVQGDGDVLGHFVLRGSSPPVPLDRGRLLVAVILADLAGAALAVADRGRHQERSN